MKAISFEWDEKRTSRTKKKHGISFEEAQTVFIDANGLLIHDPDHSDEEGRFILLGLSSNLRTLVVCHCYRTSNEITRILSALRATRSEQKEYGKRCVR